MTEIVRHRTCKIHVGEEERSIRLKKWSATKLFFLVREFWAKIEDGLNQIDELDALTEVMLVRVIVEQILSSEQQAANLIKLSIDKPDDIEESDILEWDADEFIEILTEIIEMNWTRSLTKNFQRLLAGFVKRKAKKRARSRASNQRTTEEQPQTASVP